MNGKGYAPEMCSKSIIDLVQSGVITNKYKKVHRGKIATAFAFGTHRLNNLVDDYPFFTFLDPQYVNDGKVIRRSGAGGVMSQST